MAKAKETGAAGMIDPEQGMLDAWRDLQSSGMGSLAAFAAAAAREWGAIGSEAIAFLTRRLEDDLTTQQKLLHAASPEEFRHIQAEFVQRAMDQYAEETGRMLEIGDRLLHAAARTTEG